MTHVTAKGRRQKQPDPFKRNIPVAYRAAIWSQNCACCGYEGEVHIDHVIPFSKGGTSHLENLQPLCRPCNSKKGNRIITLDDLRKEMAWRLRA